MTIARPDTPDIELVLTEWVRGLLSQGTGTEVPANLNAVLPWHRITHVAGNGLELTLDQVVVDVDSFGADRAEASDVARTMKDALLYDLPGAYFPTHGAAIGQVNCTSLPAWRAWDNTTLRRFGGTYVIVVHAVPVVPTP